MHVWVWVCIHIMVAVPVINNYISLVCLMIISNTLQCVPDSLGTTLIFLYTHINVQRLVNIKASVHYIEGVLNTEVSGSTSTDGQ